MEKLLEKILQEIKMGFSFPLALLVAVVVFYINPNNIIQYSKSEIMAFILIFFFFYAIFLIISKLFFWFQERKNIAELKRKEEDKKDMEIAIEIKNSHPIIREELFKCYSNGKDKIPRTDTLDAFIYRFKLRKFFKPNENHYVINQNVLKAIKKYHYIVFEDLYWDKRYYHQ